VATVNAKGSILSDFSRIHRNRSHDGSLVTIDQFHCLADDTNQLVLLHWSMNPSSHSHVNQFLLYYLDVADGDADLMRILAIPTSSVSIDQQSSFDRYTYPLNSSSLQSNSNRGSLFRLHLAAIDHNRNQLPMTVLPIYCTLTKSYGKTKKDFSPCSLPRERPY
jgi:hypothetical protein